MKRNNAGIVFQDEKGYYLLEGESPRRTRLNVSADEVFSEIDEETGEYIPSEEEPCLIAPEAYANKFLDRVEQEQTEAFMRNVRSLIAQGNVRMTGLSPDGEEMYAITFKGAIRASISKLAGLLSKADLACRDFTETEATEIGQCVQDLIRGQEQQEELQKG